MASRKKAAALLALKNIDAKIEEVVKASGLEVYDLFNEHLREREPFLKRRYELVSGLEEPSPEELEGFPGGANSAGSSARKGLPYFWLNVLLAQDLLAERISMRDRQALEYLVDVRFNSGGKGMLVEWHFVENPFFENKVLRKGAYIEKDAEGNISSLREESTDIEWKEGCSLLVREVKAGARRKKGKKGKKSKNVSKEDDESAADAPRRRYKPCPSIFSFFTAATDLANGGKAKMIDPTALDDDDDEDDEAEGDEELDEAGPHASRNSKSAAALAARQKQDGDMLQVLIKKVVPKAVTLFLEGPLQQSLADPLGRSDEEEEGDGFELVGRSAGCHGGDISSLPHPSQRIAHALKGLQGKMDNLMLQLKRRKWEILGKKEAEMQKLFEQRGIILDSGGPGGAVVPNFWLRALKALDVGVDCIHRRDERALAFLSDVRWAWDYSRPMPSTEDPTRHATLELHFHPSKPYFKTSVLRKRFVFLSPDGSIRRLSGVMSSEVLQPPEWEEGNDLTVKVGADGKPRQAATFFALFERKKGALRLAFNIPGEGPQSLAEAVRMEEILVNEIQSVLVVKPVDLYNFVDLEDDIPEEEEDDEEGDEESVDEDGDEDKDDDDQARKSTHGKAGQGRKAPASAAAGKAAGRLIPSLAKAAIKNWLLTLLLFICTLSGVFVFMEVLADIREGF